VNPRLEIKPVTPGTIDIEIPDDETGSNPDGGEYDNGGYVDPVGTPGGSETEVRNILTQSHIGINSNPCAQGQTKGCTNVQGLGQGAINGVVALNNTIGGGITVTGGTEGGHKTHGVGKNILDLRKNDKLDTYIIDNSTGSTGTGHGTLYTGKDGNKYLDEGNHWHVVFK
jgi:hypothetical protein